MNSMLKVNSSGVIVAAVNYTDYIGNAAIVSPANKDVAYFNGTNWINKQLTLSDISDYTAIGVNYWTKTGSDLSYTAGNVSVGVGSTAYKFEVSGGDAKLNGIIIGNSNIRNTSNLLTLGGTSEAMRITSGRVLIGTTTDDTLNLLQVNGSASIQGIRIHATGSYTSTYIGNDNGSGQTYIHNVGLGYQALKSLTGGYYNIGSSTLKSITTGNTNIAVGCKLSKSCKPE